MEIILYLILIILFIEIYAVHKIIQEVKQKKQLILLNQDKSNKRYK